MDVECPSGQKAISGGLRTFNEGCFIAASDAAINAQTWSTTVKCPAGSGGGDVIATAYCLA